MCNCEVDNDTKLVVEEGPPMVNVVTPIGGVSLSKQRNK
jgi:hypothetical protein